MKSQKSSGEKPASPQIDYVGQELSKKLLHTIFVVGFALAWVIGVYMSDIWCTLYALVVVFGAGLICAVPPWRIYRKHPVIFGEKKAQ